MSGKKSQRKGRNAEEEVAMDFRAAGFDAKKLGLYEKLDVRVAIDGRDRFLEVKRKKICASPAYKAFRSGAWGYVERADREEWLLTIPLREFFRLAAPQQSSAIGLPIEPSPVAGSVTMDWILPITGISRRSS